MHNLIRRTVAGMEEALWVFHHLLSLLLTTTWVTLPMLSCLLLPAISSFWVDNVEDKKKKISPRLVQIQWKTYILVLQWFPKLETSIRILKQKAKTTSKCAHSTSANDHLCSIASEQQLPACWLSPNFTVTISRTQHLLSRMPCLLVWKSSSLML